MGVESLCAMKGKVVRIKFNGEGHCGDTVKAIGHALKEVWFDPKELAAEMGLT